MSRNGDSNGAGEAKRRWHQRPAVIPITLVAALLGVAFGYGQMFGQVQDNTDDIAEMKVEISDALQAINRKLDLLFEPRFARRDAPR